MRFPLLFATLLACFTSPVWCAEWNISPELVVEETYSDNISLLPNGAKQSDWITIVRPGISILATGARLRFSAKYAPEVISYINRHEDNQLNQRLNATGSAELARQLLFVDIGAEVDRQNASLLGPLATSNVNTTGNRPTTKTFFTSPYLKRDFGSNVQAEARFTHSVVRSGDSSALSDTNADRLGLRLNSGPRYKLLVWDIDYATETIDSETQSDISSEVASANAKRLITPTVGLLGQVGYESYDQGLGVPVTEDNSWSTGLDWAPSARTHFVATVGKRFFGDAYVLNFTHRARLTTWSADYSETVTSTRSEFFVPATTNTAGHLDTLFSTQFPDPVARKKAVDEFIAQTGIPPSLSAPTNFFSDQLFLVKSWRVSSGVLGVRNVLIGNVFMETRESLAGKLVLGGGADSTLSGNVRQSGGSVVWNWKMSVRNALNVNVAYSRNEFSDLSRVDNLTHILIGITRQLQPKMTGSLTYRRQRNASDETSSNYVENAATAALLMRF